MKLVEAPPQAAAAAVPSSSANPQPAGISTFSDNAFPHNHLLDIPLPAQVLLAQISGRLGDLTSLSVGNVILSNRPIGEPVDLYVNGIHIASGEIINAGGSRGLRIRTMSVEA